jgi:hypothetical protein
VGQLVYVESGILSDARRETDATGTGVFSGVPPGYVDLVGDTAGLRVGGVGAYVSASSNSYTTLVRRSRAVTRERGDLDELVPGR